MHHRVTHDEAQAIAIEALNFIASDAVLLERFLTLSGLHGGDIRAAAASEEFFAAVLNFLLGHEPDLLAFCQAKNIAPATVAQAFATLPGGEALEQFPKSAKRFLG